MVQWRAYCGTGAIAWPEFDRQRRVPARGRHTVKTPSTPNFRSPTSGDRVTSPLEDTFH